MNQILMSASFPVTQIYFLDIFYHTDTSRAFVFHAYFQIQLVLGGHEIKLLRAI